MLSIDGYLDGSGADVLQISLSRGRSAVCAYDEAASLMASKTVRTIPERDRLRITATRQEDTPTEAEQHVGEVIVSAIPDSRSWPRIPPPGVRAAHGLRERLHGPVSRSDHGRRRVWGREQAAAVRLPHSRAADPREHPDAHRGVRQDIDPFER